MVKKYLPLVVALLLYAALALYQLELPGLHHDEAQEAGLPGMQLALGQTLTPFRGAQVVVANRGFPLMVQDYIGALNAYLAWFAFGVGGVSVVSLRVMTVCTGLLTLGAFFGAARALAGWRAASFGVLLLAVHPTYVFWTRQGVYVTSYTLTLALLALWLLVRWWRGGRAWNLLLAAFLLGVGLWGKLLFVWFIGGGVGAWLLLNLPRWKDATKMPPLVLVAALLAGVLGMAPLLAYNGQTGGTFANIFTNLDQSYYGVDNADFGANLRERLRQAPTVFESSHLRELGGQFKNPWARAWLLLALGACGVGAVRGRAWRGVRLFVPLLVLLMLLQSCFTSTALWFTHFALILPFMVMMGGVGAAALGRWGAALVALMLVFELLVVGRYHAVLRQTGGIDTHSAAIYELAATLPEGQPIAALDWGISPAVQVLTAGRVVPDEIFGYAWQADPGFAARLQPYLLADDAVLVLHVPQQTIFPRRELFLQLVAETERKAVLQQTIYDQRGAAYFELWRVFD